MQTDHRVTRIAALGDLHVTETPPPELRPLLEQVTASADVMVLCGDLTDQGLLSQGQTLAKELAWAVAKSEDGTSREELESCVSRAGFDLGPVAHLLRD